MRDKKQQLELDMEQQTGSKLGKEPVYYTSSLYTVTLLNLYAEYMMQNARLDDSQPGIKIVGDTLATSDMQMIPL